MCPSLSLQWLSVLPGFGAQALGDDPGSCPLVEGATGLMGAAVTQAGPVAAGRGDLPCSEAEGLLGWGLPSIQQRGQAALLVPGLPFAVLCFWVSCCTRAITACLPVGQRRFVRKCRYRDKNNLEGWQMLPKKGRMRVYRPQVPTFRSASLPFSPPCLSKKFLWQSTVNIANPTPHVAGGGGTT